MSTFNNVKYPRVTLRIPEELRDTIDRIALTNGCSVSELIKEFIKVGIALQKEKKEK